MADRFFAEAGLEGETVELSGSEAHHLVHVLRHGVGSEVELFDGRGGVARAVVSQIGRRSVKLQVLERRIQPQDDSPPITLASALPKGDRVRWLVEKATELGIHRFVPLLCQRSVVTPSRGKQSKLRQTVVEACKQCGRNWLMEVAEPQPWPSLVQQTAGRETLLVADPSGRPVDLGLLQRLREERRAVCLAVGPEGGFTQKELAEACAAGASVVSLGPRTLRIETAGITFAAWLVLSSGWGSR